MNLRQHQANFIAQAYRVLHLSLKPHISSLSHSRNKQKVVFFKASKMLSRDELASKSRGEVIKD